MDLSTFPEVVAQAVKSTRPSHNEDDWVRHSFFFFFFCYLFENFVDWFFVNYLNHFYLAKYGITYGRIW